jgi:hypothetical protein
VRGEPAAAENWKPNHISEMNYQWQLCGVPGTDGVFRAIYDIESPRTLNENAVDERLLTQPTAFRTQPIAGANCDPWIEYLPGLANPPYRFDGPTDVNCDGDTIDTGLVVDLNGHDTGLVGYRPALTTLSSHPEYPELLIGGSGRSLVGSDVFDQPGVSTGTKARLSAQSPDPAESGGDKETLQEAAQSAFDALRKRLENSEFGLDTRRVMMMTLSRGKALSQLRAVPKRIEDTSPYMFPARENEVRDGLTAGQAELQGELVLRGRKAARLRRIRLDFDKNRITARINGKAVTLAKFRALNTSTQDGSGGVSPTVTLKLTARATRLIRRETRRRRPLSRTLGRMRVTLSDLR